MKATVIYRGIFLLLACLPLVFTSHAVHAETDPNKSVSDCIGKGKDCGDDEPANAQTDELKKSEPELPDASSGLTAWDYIRTLLAFVFVIGLLVWLLRFLNKRNRSFDQNKLMANLGGVPLGQHKSIQLVKMGNHYFVVGVGENVQLLKEIEDPEEVAELVARYEQDGTQLQKGIFTQLYERFFKKAETGDPGEHADFSRMFSSKMEEIKADRKQQLDRLKRKGSDRDG